MTDLATLTVSLQAETSQYQRQLAESTKQLQAFQDNVGAAAEDLVRKFAAVFTIDKIGEFIEGAIESAASLEKLSQESGVAVEQLSALQAVFAQSGVGQDEMAASLKKLNVAISDAAGNATSKAAFAFQALGLSITNSNGSIKTAAQLLPEIADAYSHLADGANKVAINTDLFGKSGQAMIPTLNQGKQGLEDLQAAAVASGAALSGELAEAADALEKKFIALKQSATGILQTEVLEAAIPKLNAFADGLDAIAKSGTSTNAVMQVFGAALGVIGAAVLEIDGELKLLGSAIDGVGAAASAGGKGLGKAFQDALSLKGFDFVGDLIATGSSVMKVLNDQSAEAERIQKAQQDSIENILTAGGQQQVQVTEDTARASAAAFSKAFDDVLTKSAGISPDLLPQLDAAKKKVEDFEASLKAQVDSFGKGAAAQTALKLSTGALGDAVALAQKKYDELTAQGVDPYTDAAIKAAKATLDAAAAAQKLSVQQQAQIDTTEIKSYIDKLTEQVDKLDLGTLAATKYAEEHGKLGLALKDSAVDGAGFTKQIDDLTKQLIAADNEKTLTSLGVQALELQGRLVDAANAAFELQSKLPKANAASVNDTALQNQIDQTHALTVAQKAFQQEVNLTAQIRADEALQESAINAQVASGQMSELAGQQKINEARLAELAALGDVDAKMQQIANSSGIPALVVQAKQAQASLNDLAASTNALANKLRNDFEDSASDAFAAFVTGTESASQAAHQFLQSIETELVKMATKNLLEGFLGGSGGGGGSFFSALAGALAGSGAAGGAAAGAGAAATDAGTGIIDLVGGGLASGGPAKAGMSYTVGEHGAEEFVPDVPGTIVPNSKMQKGVTNNFNFTISAPSGTVSRATQAQIAKAAAMGVQSARRHM